MISNNVTWQASQNATGKILNNYLYVSFTIFSTNSNFTKRVQVVSESKIWINIKDSHP